MFAEHFDDFMGKAFRVRVDKKKKKTYRNFRRTTGHFFLFSYLATKCRLRHARASGRLLIFNSDDPARHPIMWFSGGGGRFQSINLAYFDKNLFSSFWALVLDKIELFPTRRRDFLRFQQNHVCTRGF